MRIAIYGKSVSEDSREYLENLHRKLSEANADICINKKFNEFLIGNCNLDLNFEIYEDHLSFVKWNPEILLTIGGDGTLLDSATIVRDSNIPILGINMGRLGFLANISKDEIELAADAILNRKYTFDKRNLIQVKNNVSAIMDPAFALNEVTVSRKGTTSMITVHSWINDEFLNSYWTDGLILATPTGSTGYSLSCGGPIVMPGSENFVLTPIAPHNLTVRPFVIPNDVEIKFKVESREENYLVSLDSRIYTLPSNSEIQLSLAPFQIRLVKTEFQNFASTLRNKLLWGLDRRN